MKLSANQLADHLAGSLSPVYLISGDEPLLVMEAADSILWLLKQYGAHGQLHFPSDGMRGPMALMSAPFSSRFQ